MQARGLLTFGLGTDVTAANALRLNYIVRPEMFPGASSVYSVEVTFFAIANTTFTANIYYGGTLQNTITAPVPDGTIVGTGQVTGTGFLSITINNIPKPTNTPEFWKFALLGSNTVKKLRVVMR